MPFSASRVDAERIRGGSPKVEHSAGGNGANHDTNRVGVENVFSELLADFSSRHMGSSVLSDYDPQVFYCEMLRSPASPAIRERLAGLSIEALKQRAANANAELYNLGITFTVYSDAKTIDRILPFDVIPRVLSSEEWHQLES